MGKEVYHHDNPNLNLNNNIFCFNHNFVNPLVTDSDEYHFSHRALLLRDRDHEDVQQRRQMPHSPHRLQGPLHDPELEFSSRIPASHAALRTREPTMKEIIPDHEQNRHRSHSIFRKVPSPLPSLPSIEPLAPLSARTTPTLMQGSRIGAWMLESRLGAGSYGIVWAARHHPTSPPSPTSPTADGRRRGTGSCIKDSVSTAGSHSAPTSPDIKMKRRRSFGSFLAKSSTNTANTNSYSSPIRELSERRNLPDRAAMKVIDIAKDMNDFGRLALSREVFLHSNLPPHENVTRVFEVIESPERVCIVMELVDGPCLFDYLMEYSFSHPGRQHGLSDSRASLLFWQMLSALEHCHNNNVLHRDIKLENFLINRDGTQLKLTDFGLCTSFVPGQPQRAKCGSPLYLSPELVMEEEHDGTKADIWSLGIVLYSVLLNRMPFLDSQGRLVVSKALRGITTLPNTISKSAAQVLRRILDPDPKKRATIEELKKHPWVLRGQALNAQLRAEKPQPEKKRHSTSWISKLPFVASTSSASLPSISTLSTSSSLSFLYDLENRSGHDGVTLQEEPEEPPVSKSPKSKSKGASKRRSRSSTNPLSWINTLRRSTAKNK